MRAQTALISSTFHWPFQVTVGLAEALAVVIRLFPARLRSPIFWRVQGMVVIITLFHYVVENTTEHVEPWEVLHDIPAMFYIIPIAYASLYFRLEEGILTALWSAALTTPDAVWHPGSFEWLIELLEVTSGLAVGVMVSQLVAREAAQRKRAEEMAARVSLLHQQSVRAAEEERRRIARELHDDTAQSLILLCRGLDRVAATGRLPKAVQGTLGDLRPLAEQILGDIRRFSRDLRPTLLDDLGLVAAVEWLASDFTKRLGINAQVTVTGSRHRLTLDAELAFFRIAQEALRNVEKHAEASEVSIRLAFEDDGLRLSLLDKGKGFERPASFSTLAVAGHLGLLGMQERAELVGATFGVWSKVGQGTRVSITIRE